MMTGTSTFQNSIIYGQVQIECLSLRCLQSILDWPIILSDRFLVFSFSCDIECDVLLAFDFFIFRRILAFL